MAKADADVHMAEAEAQEDVYDEYLKRICRKIDNIRILSEGGDKGGPFLNKEKCKYLAQELKTRIASSLPSASTDMVRPVLRDIYFLVHAAKRLVMKSCKKKWWNKAFWMGDCTEAFGDIILDLQTAMDSIWLHMKANHNGSSRTNEEGAAHKSISRSGAELGHEWEAIVLEDRAFLISNVRLVVHRKSDLGKGRRLSKADLEIAKHLQAKLDGKFNRMRGGTVIDLGQVVIVERIVEGRKARGKQLAASIHCIRWHGKRCVMKGFHDDEQATNEAAIMGDLMHPHVVQLIGYAHHKNSWAIFSQPSPKVLLEYAEKGDLLSYIDQLRKDLELDVIVDVMLQIAKGMHYIHSRKIAHLDLKSKNIFVTHHVVPHLQSAEFFHVKIGDFGSAIRCDGPIPDSIYGHGTTRWRAPELFPNAPRAASPMDLDLYKADVYSYAMVCVELLTRKIPFHDECPTLHSVYQYISAQNRPSLPGTCPTELLSIIRRCWDAEPAKRPSFDEVIELLKDMKREMLFNDEFYSVVAKAEAEERKMWRLIPKMTWAPPGEWDSFADDPTGEPRIKATAVAQSSQSYPFEEPYIESRLESEISPYSPKREPTMESPALFIEPTKSVTCLAQSSQSYPFEEPSIESVNSLSTASEFSQYSPKREPTMESPALHIETTHPPFNAEGCAMLIQLGEHVRRKIDDFVNQGAAIGQHMFTSRLSHLQPIVGEFQVQLQILFSGGNNLHIAGNGLFGEMFNVLKKVEFFLAGCTWPALGFRCGPTATDEGFLWLRRNLQLCVQMMRYSIIQPQDTSFAEVSKFLFGPNGAMLEDVNSNTDSPWSRACLSDRYMLLRFLSFSLAYSFPSLGSLYSDVEDHHRYLGSIALISVDSTTFCEHPSAFRIPKEFTRNTQEIYWDDGPDGTVLGPIAFLQSEIHHSDSIRHSKIELEYHQPAVLWAVKVYPLNSKKLAHNFIQLASLQHPHVVQIFGHWEYDGSGYVAMKMMQGNLIQYLRQKQDTMLSALYLLNIVIQIAEGMSYLHSHHVHHHNLKCSNVLVGGCYEDLELVHVEVSDYGFERKQLSEEDLDLDLESSGLGSSTTAIPDAIQFGEGEETDEYAFDVFQFSMLCLEIFSIRGAQDQVPLQGTGPESGELSEGLRPHSVEISFPAKCPPDLASNFQKCASKDPKERPKFPEICTMLLNHKAYMLLSGKEGTGSGPSERELSIGTKASLHEREFVKIV